MTKRIIFSIFALLLAICTFAQDDATSATQWAQANEQYASGNYQEAILAYENILTVNPTAEVYYNLGNAYFKIGEVAQSILAYERALRLRPNYTDAKHNLRFAEAKIIDNIEDNSRFFLSQWAEAFRNLTTERVWFILSVVFFVLCLIGAFVFAFMHTAIVRKLGFHCAWVALLISIITLCCAFSLHKRDSRREEAIIVQGIVNAKASPDKSGTDLFVLHEGTKVRISDIVSDWAEIHVGGNIGWISLSALERI